MSTGSNERIAAKLRLLDRLLISYIDFHHAARIASYIIDHQLQDKVNRLHGRRRYRIRLLWEALNSAMIVAYCRPFSGNDRGRNDTVARLPRRFLKGLSAGQLEIHETAMDDRNRLLAHSDSAAWAVSPYWFKTGTAKAMLAPSHRDARAPLVHEAVVVLQSICGQLMDRIMDERTHLEEELASFLPEVYFDEVQASIRDDAG